MAQAAHASQLLKTETFHYQGKDRRGSPVQGEIKSESISLAKAQLRKQGILAQTVRKKGKPLFGERKKAITPADIAVFSRQLATMMKAGVPLVQSFDIVADGQDNAAFRELIVTLRNDVAGGNSLASALAKHPRQFDDLFCNLVHAGEQSGKLDSMLDRVATYKEKTEALKAKIRKALTYPAAVILVAIIVTTILLIWVVPQFAETFSSFGADLPAFTLLVLKMSQFMQAYWWVVLGSLAGAGFAFREARLRNQKFADQVDALTLRIPIVGPIVKEAVVARFAAYAVHHLRGRCAAGGGAGVGGGCCRQRRLREGDPPDPRRRDGGHAAQPRDSLDQHLPDDAAAHGGDRRGVRRARFDAGQGGDALRDGGRQQGRWPDLVARAADHGGAGRAGRRADGGDVSADLHAWFRDVMSGSVGMNADLRTSVGMNADLRTSVGMNADPHVGRVSTRRIVGRVSTRRMPMQIPVGMNADLRRHIVGMNADPRTSVGMNADPHVGRVSTRRMSCNNQQAPCRPPR
jgi:type II secretory pathway component PulF